MRLLILAVLSLATALPARADVATVLDRLILPGTRAFAATTSALADAAAADCTPATLLPPYNAAFDAWMAIAHLRIGPGEAAAPTIAFWPDPRGATPKALAHLAQDPAARLDDPTAFAQTSAAARGLLALDALLAAPPPGDACGLTRAVARDLAAQADALDTAWRDSFAATLRSAGQPGNATYLSAAEAARALYTQMQTGLAFVADARLGRPLDTFDRPRPARAEAWRTARSLPNITGSLIALRDLARTLAPGPIPKTEAAFDAALAAAARIADPGLQDITDPQAWLRADILRQRVQAIGPLAESEIAAPLGLRAGFNALDGD